MTELNPAELELDTARQTYPVGDHVTGTVTLIPRPGTIGLFVDLGQPPTGFVDVIHFPDPSTSGQASALSPISRYSSIATNRSASGRSTKPFDRTRPTSGGASPNGRR